MSDTLNTSFLHAATSRRYQSPVTCTQPSSVPVTGPVTTPAEDVRLSGRQEQSQGGGLLSRMSAQVIRPFVALQKWIGSLLGRDGAHATSTWTPKEPLDPNDLGAIQRERLAKVVKAFDGVESFANFTAEDLAARYQELAINNGGFRRVATGLKNLKGCSLGDEINSRVWNLENKDIEGISFLKWGDPGPFIKSWFSLATPMHRMEQVMSDPDLSEREKVSRMESIMKKFDMLSGGGVDWIGQWQGSVKQPERLIS